VTAPERHRPSEVIESATERCPRPPPLSDDPVSPSRRPTSILSSWSCSSKTGLMGAPALGPTGVGQVDHLRPVAADLGSSASPRSHAVDHAGIDPDRLTGGKLKRVELADRLADFDQQPAALQGDRLVLVSMKLQRQRVTSRDDAEELAGTCPRRERSAPRGPTAWARTELSRPTVISRPSPRRTIWSADPERALSGRVTRRNQRPPSAELPRTGASRPPGETASTLQVGRIDQAARYAYGAGRSYDDGGAATPSRSIRRPAEPLVTHHPELSMLNTIVAQLVGQGSRTVSSTCWLR